MDKAKLSGGGGYQHHLFLHGNSCGRFLPGHWVIHIREYEIAGFSIFSRLFNAIAELGIVETRVKFSICH